MRLFLIGDSFTDNLFKLSYDEIEKVKNNAPGSGEYTEIRKYLIYLEQHGYEKAKWFDDLLVDMGYEVYNFAQGGCTIEDIIYQFSNLSKFEKRDDDRIILNWTHPSRFNWIRDSHTVHYAHSNWHPIWGDNNSTNSIAKLMQQQAINREESFSAEYGYLNRKLLPFMEYLIEMHSKYKPIVWSPFADLDEIIADQKWVFSFIGKEHYSDFLSKLPNNMSIIDETDFLFEDHHFGRAGNYYIATLLDEIIKSDIGPNYMNNKYIFNIVLNRIKLENKKFTI